MIKELICINCPMGCHLIVDTETKIVKGNTCKRGEVYGIDEVTNPVRVVTSTVKVKNGTHPVLPVKTSTAIPKDMNFKCIEEINKVEVEVEATIKMGDVIIENILGTGVNLVASRNL